MSASAETRRHLHLILEGYPAENLTDISPANAAMEIVRLTPANAREALEKIFAADTIAVWGRL